MTDGQLERRLREYFQADVGEEGASLDLLTSVLGIPETAPVTAAQRRRVWLLLAAAALLIALLVGTALAMGSRIWDPLLTTRNVLPAPSATPVAYALPPLTLTTASLEHSSNPCDGPPLPDGVVAFVMAPSPVAGQASGVQGSGTDSAWVFADGRVLVAPAGPLDQPWAQRRLSQQGFDQLLNAMVRPELPGCRTYVLGTSMPSQSGTSTPSQFVLAVQPSSTIYAIDAIGPSPPDPLDPQLTTPVQVAALAHLQASLADPDLGLGTGAWLNAWSPYIPDTWQVQVDMLDGPSGAPAMSDVVLPDGTPLLQVGADDPTAAQRGVNSARCAMVDHATASALLQELPGPGDPVAGSWDFSNGNVTVGPALPGTRCPTAADVIAPGSPGASPAPPTTASPPPTTAPSGTQACAFLSSDDVQRTLGDPHLATSAKVGGLFKGWVECDYGSDYRGTGIMAPDTGRGILLVRQQAVSASQAEEVALSLFGDASTALQIAGHRVFYNGCEPGTDQSGCTPSVAISSEPDLIVLTWQHSSKDGLLALATALLQKADAGTQP